MYAPISKNFAADCVLYKTCFLARIASFFCTDCLDSPKGRERDRTNRGFPHFLRIQRSISLSHSVPCTPPSPSDCLETAELNGHVPISPSLPFTVCSNRFYADIWNHHQVQQYESCLKSLAITLANLQMAFLFIKAYY